MSAVFSADLKKRYRLERGEGPFVVLWLMVNPSDADAESDDPTVRKVNGFTLRWFGPARRMIGNLFAHQARDVEALKLAFDPVGADNDAHLRAMLGEADVVVFGWGALGKLPAHLRDRWLDVYRLTIMAGHAPVCFGVNADGHPRHPLMTAYDTPPTFWTRPHG